MLISFSCGNNVSSAKVKTYKVTNLQYNFSLPERFAIITAKDLKHKMEGLIELDRDLLRGSQQKNQALFFDSTTEDLVIISPFPERVPIEKLFLNSFADMIEQGTIQASGVDYERVEKKFIKNGNYNSLFKVKFKYSVLDLDNYLTTYFLTNHKESLMVTVQSSGEDDLQDMLTRYLNKN